MLFLFPNWLSTFSKSSLTWHVFSLSVLLNTWYCEWHFWMSFCRFISSLTNWSTLLFLSSSPYVKSTIVNTFTFEHNIFWSVSITCLSCSVKWPNYARNISWMHWNASSVMYPGIIGCFGSRNIIHPRPGDPAGVDQAPTYIPVAVHGSALLIQSHLVAFSAASHAYRMALFLATPVTPKRLRTLQSERPAKPLQPTSIGS